MGRYKKEHAVVDVSIVPFMPLLAKKTVIADTETKRQAEGYDWRSFQESERKAWEKLKCGK